MFTKATQKFSAFSALGFAENSGAVSLAAAPIQLLFSSKRSRQTCRRRSRPLRNLETHIVSSPLPPANDLYGSTGWRVSLFETKGDVRRRHVRRPAIVQRR